MLIQSMTVGNMAVCCYLVGCKESGKGIIIDPGGDEAAILKLCEQQQLKIEAIVNTHGHPDHVCGNGPLRKATGAAIVMHEADAAFFERPEVEEYFSILGLPPSPPPDRTVRDGDRIEFGTVTLEVIHTPGHTPGGICLYGDQNLFTGDTLFVGGIGRTDFPGGDYDTLMRSIKDRLFSLPADTVVWPGHGYGGQSSTLGAERRGNPFLSGL